MKGVLRSCSREVEGLVVKEVSNGVLFMLAHKLSCGHCADIKEEYITYEVRGK